MYYKIHGTGRPLVLLHGSLTTIDTSFGKLLPSLSETGQVISMEQQGHGRTADTDRPLTYEQMAEDTTELLRQLRIEKADFFGYSMGSAVAMQIAKEQQLTREFKGWKPDEIQAIKPPAFIITCDSDVVRPEHVIEIFRLLGGGVAGDLTGLPRSRLAMLPGTTHVTMAERADWLLPMIKEFLNVPVPEGND
ncbi:MAG TPA: alpha/beta fold hydrolase [Methanosarcina sp.]|nr:alpha/beta fold hydrolase [Methanosarcina sp.]